MLANLRANRDASAGPTILFVARLEAAKGIPQLIAALRQLDQAMKPDSRTFTVKVLGTGPLAGEVAACAASLRNVALHFLDPVAYGPAFFAHFADIDALVVTNLADEQPRIIFDAASQGVATIGFATTGVASIIESNQTGLLLPVGSVNALTTALHDLLNPAQLESVRAMGDAARAQAREYDHVAMHQRRQTFLRQNFQRSPHSQ